VEWILFISLQWVVLGNSPPPATQQIGPFGSEELCNRAAEAIRTEMNAPITGQRIQTFVRITCFALKNNDQSSMPREKRQN
jgi:hypothetical protein